MRSSALFDRVRAFFGALQRSGGSERWRARTAVLAILSVVAALASVVAVVTGPAAAAGPCGPPVVSVIACENTLPGTAPSSWQVSGAGDSTIQGFATR